MKHIFLSLALCSFIFAKCYYIPCDGNVNMAEQQTKAKLQPEFEGVMSELKILKEKYGLNLKAYEKSNELLREQIALTKEKALKNKELVFLLRKFNQSLSLTINAEVTADEENKNAN
ncbi:hypothetical protein LMG7974_01617 [Campylobacter majalis]|uniref:Uncharacterized protein n=1 Tax=Campylobacter majalis TaxID=2790656 RepID=A0ABM8Q977_9BACT|nr:hypothetical protein [Campylobacter majalis]CAD7289540.1 hypothetical protein LMG7974_01617 [Campylobacter majalis]